MAGASTEQIDMLRTFDPGLREADAQPWRDGIDAFEAAVQKSVKKNCREGTKVEILFEKRIRTVDVVSLAKVWVTLRLPTDQHSRAPREIKLRYMDVMMFAARARKKMKRKRRVAAQAAGRTGSLKPGASDAPRAAVGVGISRVNESIDLFCTPSVQ